MTLNKQSLPKWVEEDAQIKDAKWLNDEEVLVLVESSVNKAVTLQMIGKDYDSVQDFGGVYNPQITRESFSLIFNRIESEDDFFEERRMLIRTLLGNFNNTVH